MLSLRGFRERLSMERSIEKTPRLLNIIEVFAPLAAF
jgi:hypothetical protein